MMQGNVYVTIPKKNGLNKDPGIRVLMIAINRTEITSVKKLLCEIDSSIVFSSSSSPERTKLLIDTVDIVLFCIKNKDPKTSSFIALFKLHKEIPVIAIGKLKKDTIFSGISYTSVLLWDSVDKQILSDSINSAIAKRATTTKFNDNLKEFQDNEARYLNVILSSADGVVIVSRTKKIQFINPAARKMLGFNQNGIRIGAFPYKVEAGSSQELQIPQIGKIPNKFLEMRVSEVQWDQKDAQLISLRDISTRKQAEQSLRVSEERYVVATKGSNNGLWDWDLKNKCIYFCDQWKAMLGLDDSEIIATAEDWFKKIHAEDIKDVRDAIDLHLQGKNIRFESEHRILHKNGGYRWVLVSGSVIRGKNGKPLRFAGTQTDITERKEAEEELKKSLDDLKFALASEKVLMEELDRKNKELIELSITDGLTGMYNHRFLQDRLDYEFKRVRRYGGMLSCMIIDIDHFKLINDNYGHQVGDQVLRQIATIMKQKSREIDICGRYGGEEFLIITNLLMDNALRYATKLHTAVEDHVFECSGKSIRVTVSIGIAEYNSDIKSKQELIERADTAMYQAKMDGRNLIRIWKAIDSNDEMSVDRLGIQDLKGKFQDLSNQMRFIYMESTNALIKAVDAKDPFAREHSRNVSEYAKEIAKFMKLSEQDIEVIHYAGLLHDVGKIGIKDDILVKKDELTPNELEILKRHPEVGVNILKDIKFLEKEIPVILHHHERYDGKGYPHGLRGREIPVGARIIAVADAFDAMTSGRTYKTRLPWKKAVDEIKKGSGTQFAPEIVEAFVMLEECGKIAPRSK